MAQLWGGRFTKETDQLVYNFNASISFDQKFYKQDIEGSIAHVRMLGKQGILTQEEMQAIVSCLQEILADVESGKLAITSEYEDIHSFVEANLIDRLGDTGKKLHTGRSRNDQVALDMRLYTRQQVLETDELLEQLQQVLLRIMKENTQTIMPGFTHLQKAQPITLAHHMGAYFEMFKRDRSRMHDSRLLRTDLQQYGRCFRPRLPDRISVCHGNHYDAFKPLLRGNYHLEFQRIQIRRD